MACQCSHQGSSPPPDSNRSRIERRRTPPLARHSIGQDQALSLLEAAQAAQYSAQNGPTHPSPMANTFIPQSSYNLSLSTPQPARWNAPLVPGYPTLGQTATFGQAFPMQPNGTFNGFPNGGSNPTAAVPQTIRHADGSSFTFPNGVPNGFANGYPNQFTNGLQNGLQNGFQNGHQNGHGLQNGLQNGTQNGFQNGLQNGIQGGLSQNDLQQNALQNSILNGGPGELPNISPVQPIAPAQQRSGCCSSGRTAPKPASTANLGMENLNLNDGFSGNAVFDASTTFGNPQPSVTIPNQSGPCSTLYKGCKCGPGCRCPMCPEHPDNGGLGQMIQRVQVAFDTELDVKEEGSGEDLGNHSPVSTEALGPINSDDYLYLDATCMCSGAPCGYINGECISFRNILNEFQHQTTHNHQSRASPIYNQSQPPPNFDQSQLPLNCSVNADMPVGMSRSQSAGFEFINSGDLGPSGLGLLQDQTHQTGAVDGLPYQFMTQQQQQLQQPQQPQRPQQQQQQPPQQQLTFINEGMSMFQQAEPQPAQDAPQVSVQPKLQAAG